jgi:hypothetical protein
MSQVNDQMASSLFDMCFRTIVQERHLKYPFSKSDLAGCSLVADNAFSAVQKRYQLKEITIDGADVYYLPQANIEELFTRASKAQSKSKEMQQQTPIKRKGNELLNHGKRPSSTPFRSPLAFKSPAQTPFRSPMLLSKTPATKKKLSPLTPQCNEPPSKRTELMALKADIERLDKEHRKYEMYTKYSQKNDDETLDKLISKWRAASIEALFDLRGALN